jgi:hypothetical protein
LGGLRIVALLFLPACSCFGHGSQIGLKLSLLVSLGLIKVVPASRSLGCVRISEAGASTAAIDLLSVSIA